MLSSHYNNRRLYPICLSLNLRFLQSKTGPAYFLFIVLVASLEILKLLATELFDEVQLIRKQYLHQSYLECKSILYIFLYNYGIVCRIIRPRIKLVWLCVGIHHILWLIFRLHPPRQTSICQIFTLLNSWIGSGMTSSDGSMHQTANSVKVC